MTAIVDKAKYEARWQGFAEPIIIAIHCLAAACPMHRSLFPRLGLVGCLVAICQALRAGLAD